ncbi:formylmethanofuran dehydrogenase subunit A [Derxia gummosa]|uniref:Formylmethanofuran dehydrogenase subunit A n=1 Tax=Derxia gummosa DSM 723 TaxID=1121388 RepID=A0A8B6X2Z6_9BURK|nr:formylmethanofuran dehydrogenase subunit A [Derxia gummosa]
MSTLRIKGGRLYDPANNIDGEVRDIYVRDGRIVAADPDARVTREIDATGLIVMAGGIDMHTHIGGGKVNLARMLLPEDHRGGFDARHDKALERIGATDPDIAEVLASCGTCTPGTLATGYRYVEMGYTSAFEPAMAAHNARHAHMEMGDVPILDHGAYVMLGNDDVFLSMLAEGEEFARIRDYVGWSIHAHKAMGVKVVNPGGISAFKFNQRKLDVDEEHAHYRVTPRSVVQTLARAIHELGVPHPLHIHGSNLGVPGNIESTLATIDALGGLPAHLTHIQFHSYTKDGPKKFGSGVAQLVEMLRKHPNVSIDVGQILFGQTVTASGDTMRQFANSGVAHPRKWVGADLECDAGCGVVPFKYREQSFVNALQWAIGLEIFLTMDDPWRVVLTTDHPNGGPFTSYPHLIRLLMDKPFRDEQMGRLNADAVALMQLGGLKREFTLYDIAVMTRAGPAKLLGLADRGQLGIGAAADIAIYREGANAEETFSRPAFVLKDGVVVAQDGRITAAPTGGVHFAEPEFDAGIENYLGKYTRFRSTGLKNAVIGRDELCACGNGGSLLPHACKVAA